MNRLAAMMVATALVRQPDVSRPEARQDVFCHACVRWKQNLHIEKHAYSDVINARNLKHPLKDLDRTDTMVS